MAPSFNPATMSVEQAADFVAMQAEVGSSRRGLTKEAMAMPSLSGMSNPALGALIGGGLGAGAGLIGSRGDDEEKRKNWLSNMLTGGLLGAGVGGAAGFGWDASKGLRNGGDPVQIEIDKIYADIAKDNAAAAASRQPSRDYVGDLVTSLMPDGGYSPGVTPKRIKRLKQLGQDTTQLERSYASNLGDLASVYTEQPYTAGAAGLGGAGLGYLYDRAKAKIPGLDHNFTLSPDGVKAIKAQGDTGGLGDVLTRAQGELQAARNLDGRLVKPSLLARMTGAANTKPPAYVLPETPPAPNWLQRRLGLTPKTPYSQPVPLMKPQEWSAMRKAVPPTRGPVGMKGRMVGGAGALLLYPFISRMLEWNQQPASPFVPPPRTR